MVSRKACALLVGVSVLSLCTGAYAQPVPAAPASAAAGGLEEVVVTANKVASDQQRTPIALRVVSGDNIQSAGVNDVRGLARIAPELSISTGVNTTTLGLRGVSAQTGTEGADAALAVNIDGEYINRPIALNANFFDLDRVEVLKGPQGTLYGRNSTAGTINIITKKPVNNFGGYAAAGMGNFHAWNVEGALNLPINDRWAVRVAGLHTQHDGYRDNGPAGRGDSANITAIRGTLAYKGEKVSAYLQGEYGHVDQTPGAQYGVPITPAIQGLVAFPTLGGGVDYLPVNSVFALPKYDFPLLLKGSFKSNQYHLRGQVAVALTDRVDLTYTGGFLHSRTSDFSPLAGSIFTPQFTSSNPLQGSEDWSNELRLSYRGDGGLFLQAGGFYFHETQQETISTQIINPPFGPPGTTIAYANYLYRPWIKTNSIALFAQGDIPITSTLTVTAGVRYSRDKKRGLYYNAGLGFVAPALGLTFPTTDDILAGSGGVLPGSCSGVSGGSFSVLNQCYGPKGQVNWLLSAQWTPREDHMLYAKVSTGYRSGGFDNLTSQVINGQQYGKFDPETITSYEIGSKNRFHNDRMQLNLAAFRYDYTNMQIDSFISSAIGFATINAGRAKFNGMEADFTAQVTPSDRINAAVNFLDAKFTRFSTFATGLSGGAPILDFSGNQPANAPKWTVALGYEHAFDLVEAGSLTASIFSRYKSKYYLGTSNFAAQLQEAHTQTDVSLTYDSVDGRYSVQGYVRNLENYVPVTFASFTGGPPINIFNFIFGAPRTYGVEARYHF